MLEEDLSYSDGDLILGVTVLILQMQDYQLLVWINKSPESHMVDGHLEECVKVDQACQVHTKDRQGIRAWVPCELSAVPSSWKIYLLFFITLRIV